MILVKLAVAPGLAVAIANAAVDTPQVLPKGGEGPDVRVEVDQSTHGPDVCATRCRPVVHRIEGSEER